VPPGPIPIEALDCEGWRAIGDHLLKLRQNSIYVKIISVFLTITNQTARSIPRQPARRMTSGNLRAEPRAAVDHERGWKAVAEIANLSLPANVPT
jgi:hypothetical protein